VAEGPAMARSTAPGRQREQELSAVQSGRELTGTVAGMDLRSRAQVRSNSPSCTPRVKASHSAGVKISTGPSGRLLSRMAMTWLLPSFEPGTKAISTQAPPFPPLKEDLRQVAPVKSISRSPS